MNKLAVLTEIHGLIQVILQLPNSAFSDPDQKNDLIENLAEYYVAVATDKSAAVVQAKYTACRTMITTAVADPGTRDRLDRGIDDINDDLTPTP